MLPSPKDQKHLAAFLRSRLEKMQNAAEIPGMPERLALIPNEIRAAHTLMQICDAGCLEDFTKQLQGAPINETSLAYQLILQENAPAIAAPPDFDAEARKQDRRATRNQRVGLAGFIGLMAGATGAPFMAWQGVKNEAVIVRMQNEATQLPPNDPERVKLEKRIENIKEDTVDIFDMAKVLGIIGSLSGYVMKRAMPAIEKAKTRRDEAHRSGTDQYAAMNYFQPEGATDRTLPTMITEAAVMFSDKRLHAAVKTEVRSM